MTGRAVTVVAVAGLCAATSVGQLPARITVTPDAVLLEEPFRITVEGVAPAEDVTIRAEGNRGVWKSSATFRSDDRGRVDVPDPMRLVWSATGERPAAAAGAADQPWTFTAEASGRVLATQTIVRRAVAANVRMRPLRERGLVGTVYEPPGEGRRATLIVLPGSQGGIPPPTSWAGGLASRGYVVLALAYFNAEGLPPLLQNIPLEYFATAVEWLTAQPFVDAQRIGVIGTSRGGELALLLGATYPGAFRVVVANVPSNVVWPGLSDDSDTPAWTVAGKPVTSVPSRFTAMDRHLPGRERFLTRMADAASVAPAEIPVERIGGPVLLFAGKDDQLWPSDVFCERVVRRLEAHTFKHPVEHYAFENAGHQIARPFVPTSDIRQVRVHPISKRPIVFGGTPEGQSLANEQAWAKLLAFLETHLSR